MAIDGQKRFERSHVEQENAYFSIFWRLLVVCKTSNTRFFCRGVPYFPSVVLACAFKFCLNFARFQDRPYFFGSYVLEIEMSVFWQLIAVALYNLFQSNFEFGSGSELWHHGLTNCVHRIDVGYPAIIIRM